MIYKFRPSEKNHKRREPRSLRRAGAGNPRRLYGYRTDEIDFSRLFEIAKLEESTDNKKKKRREKTNFSDRLRPILLFPFRLILRLISLISAAIWGILRFFLRSLKRIIEKRKNKKAMPSIVPTLAGAFAGVVLVSAVSALAVLYKLFIADYYGRYHTVIIPQMVGISYESAREKLNENIESYNIRVSYEYSDTVPRGIVIKQSPEGGVGRKIYFGEELADVGIVVSRGREAFIMPDLVGKSGRDSLLELKNMGAIVICKEFYSSDVPSGSVISSEPQTGESFYLSDAVTLSISRGAEKKYASVPNVLGFTESRAISLIIASGLSLGEVSYQSSQTQSGRVISQSIARGNKVEYGEKISLVISAGDVFGEKNVPSLYGKTLNEARQALAACGLVLGDIYAVKSSEPSGTVISQSPAAGSAITSTTISVDIYVSS